MEVDSPPLGPTIDDLAAKLERLNNWRKFISPAAPAVTVTPPPQAAAGEATGLAPVPLVAAPAASGAVLAKDMQALSGGDLGQS